MTTRLAPAIEANVRSLVATVTFSRPPVNALTEELIGELVQTVRQVADSDDVRAVVIAGSGGAFSAGFDIDVLGRTPPSEVRSRNARLVRRYQELADSPKPVIAAVDGYALGGGLELALACDLRVVSKDAVVGLPEIGLAGVPGIGGMQRLSRQIGLGPAMRLVLTGERVDGQEAHRLGLAELVAPPGGALDVAHSVAAEMARHSPLAVASARRAMTAGLDLPLSEAVELDLDAVEAVGRSSERLARLEEYAHARSERS
jgi:enoyl-CoA hydratase